MFYGVSLGSREDIFDTTWMTPLLNGLEDYKNDFERYVGEAICICNNRSRHLILVIYRIVLLLRLTRRFSTLVSCFFTFPGLFTKVLSLVLYWFENRETLLWPPSRCWYLHAPYIMFAIFKSFWYSLKLFEN